MPTWEFVSRRRRWTVKKVAVNNSLLTPKQFCTWCDSREIGHPAKEELMEYFVKPKKPEPAFAKKVEGDKVHEVEKPKKGPRKKRAKKTQNVEE